MPRNNLRGRQGMQNDHGLEHPHWDQMKNGKIHRISKVGVVELHVDVSNANPIQLPVFDIRYLLSSEWHCRWHTAIKHGI